MDNKTFAIIGLILGIFTGLPGIIVSVLALKKFNQTGETDGKGIATAGLIIGIIVFVFAIIGTSCYACLICTALAEGMA